LIGRWRPSRRWGRNWGSFETSARQIYGVIARGNAPKQSVRGQLLCGQVSPPDRRDSVEIQTRGACFAPLVAQGVACFWTTKSDETWICVHHAPSLRGRGMPPTALFPAGTKRETYTMTERRSPAIVLCLLIVGLIKDKAFYF